MGTTWTVKLVIPSEEILPVIRAGIEKQLNLVVNQMSTWEEHSHLSCFNRAPAGTWQALPPEFYRVLDYALSVACDTGGAYDPTAGPLVNLWGFGPNYPRTTAPASALIGEVRQRSGWWKIKLDPEMRAAFQPGGIYVDLSAVAKGYAADRIAGFLEESGIANYLVETGGELRGAGFKPDASPWWVGIEQPPGFESYPETIVACFGIAVATSGDYRRYFEQGGRRYSHTIDPRTGYPVNHNLASVTVLHESCMPADALSTALTVLGPEEGFSFARRHNLAAHFLERTPPREMLTPSFAEMAT
jgi:thiamine biosynthesis lipoprotein